jgi:hypothetical protein
MVVVPTRQVGNRFLGSIKGLQIQAQQVAFASPETLSGSLACSLGAVALTELSVALSYAQFAKEKV